MARDESQDSLLANCNKITAKVYVYNILSQSGIDQHININFFFFFLIDNNMQFTKIQDIGILILNLIIIVN